MKSIIEYMIILGLSISIAVTIGTEMANILNDLYSGINEALSVLG